MALQKLGNKAARVHNFKHTVTNSPIQVLRLQKKALWGAWAEEKDEQQVAEEEEQQREAEIARQQQALQHFIWTH